MTPCLLTAALLSACGGGSSGSHDVDGQVAESLLSKSTVAAADGRMSIGGAKRRSPGNGKKSEGDEPTAPAPVAPMDPPPVAESSGTVTAWVRLALESQAFVVEASQQVRFGDGLSWVTKTATTGSGSCSVSYFGSDPKSGARKFCEVQVTVPAVLQTGTMPVVNTALIPKPSIAHATARVRTLTSTELALAVYQPSPSRVGAFREPCSFSHMSFDDPIVYPGQPGAAHLHTFLGNADTAAASTSDSIMNSGNSTCAGGVLNRTAYWKPSMIDIRTGQPIVPSKTLFYYKLGHLGVAAGSVRSYPKGLRMIAGDSNNTAPLSGFKVRLSCVASGVSQGSMPSCPIGDDLNLAVVFPQCWDGVNVDSPDHKSHMAYATGSGCPSTHPVPLPEVTMNVYYRISEANSGEFLKLSSDNYAGAGGHSLHADWFGGWDTPISETFIGACINANMDCHAQLLGDGRWVY